MMSSPSPCVALLAFCSLLHLPGSSIGTNVKAHNLTATAGGDVTLKCQLLVQDTNVTQMNWNLCNDVHIASHINNYKTAGAVVGSFKERVSLAEDYGIKISNVNSSDERFYCCVFNTFPRGKFTGKIYLTVLTASSMWTRRHISWIILPCGILLLATGCLAIFCHKRRSGKVHNGGKPKCSSVNPIYMGTPSSLPATSTAQDGGDNSQNQDYFNVILYCNLSSNINV